MVWGLANNEKLLTLKFNWISRTTSDENILVYSIDMIWEAIKHFGCNKKVDDADNGEKEADWKEWVKEKLLFHNPITPIHFIRYSQIIWELPFITSHSNRLFLWYKIDFEVISMCVRNMKLDFPMRPQSWMGKLLLFRYQLHKLCKSRKISSLSLSNQ